ncbi:MAG: hypothetical protein SFV52_07800 [Saprospiraceae bacterium]|nr:hypothetical protein [Saprospiraceae bacterium]
MKPLPFALLLLSAPAAGAQTCREAAAFFKEGVLMVYTNFDAKGKIESVMQERVVGVAEKNDTLIVQLDVRSLDDKGKEVFHNTVPVKCYQDAFLMDMRSLVPSANMNSTDASIQMEISGTDLVYPANMQPGQSLPDSEMQLKTTVNGLPVMTNNFRVYNRKVAARETVTTPAGAFDCLKVTYTLEIKMLGTRTSNAEYWFSPGVGTVRSVTYDKKGNRVGSMELTKVER